MKENSFPQAISFLGRIIHLYIPNNWKPAFGQVNAAQSYLCNQKVREGDLFLFFGWYRAVESRDGLYRYKRRKEGGRDIHAIYGYLQVGKVLTDPEDQEEIARYAWHPHAHSLDAQNNTLYLARDKLSFDESKPGCGYLSYREDRVLTAEGQTRSIWRGDIKALGSKNIASEKTNRAKGPYICYPGIWQEMVLKENDESVAWAKSILRA